MESRRLLFSTILLLFSFSILAINFSRVNIAWQYDVNAELKMTHRIIQSQGTITVFVRIESDSLETWSLDYLVQNGYESENHRNLTLKSSDTLSYDRGSINLRLIFPVVDENLMVIKVFKTDQFYYYDIPLKIGTLSFPSIYPVDSDGFPIMSTYISKLDYSFQGSDGFHAIQYPEKFLPADPPMADMKPLTTNVPSDTSFVFKDSIDLVRGKFYVIRSDSNASTGITVMRMPPYYPEYRQLRELVESMLYITSDPERKSLINSKNLKQSFDSFWMNNFATKSRARGAIRRYYDWVEQANRLFTDFKPGWKTDRGMMLIVFGIPDEVYRTGSLEEWFYDTGEAFEFSIISSFFAPRTYTLRRSKELEDTWFQHIAAIRRGFNE